eukprot:EG_transcript_13441
MGVHAVVDWIHAKRLERKNVLIHCDAGLTRSPTIATAYLMKYGTALTKREPLSYRDAIHLVTQQRGPKVDVRLFERELKLFEQQLKVLGSNPNPNLLPSSRSWTNLLEQFDMMSPPISPAMHPISLNLQLPTRCCKATPDGVLAPPCWSSSPPSSSVGASPAYTPPSAAANATCLPPTRQSPTPSRAPPAITTTAPPTTDSVPPPSPLALSASWHTIPAFSPAPAPVLAGPPFGSAGPKLHAPFPA